MYNAVWTSWPCLFFFGLDIDANAKNSIKFPELYAAGHTNYYFNLKTFWKWMAFAFYQGALAFFVPSYVSKLT
jgi:magnesium-transporting ATPase (P-type)